MREHIIIAGAGRTRADPVKEKEWLVTTGTRNDAQLVIDLLRDALAAVLERGRSVDTGNWQGSDGAVAYTELLRFVEGCTGVLDDYQARRPKIIQSDRAATRESVVQSVRSAIDASSELAGGPGPAALGGTP